MQWVNIQALFEALCVVVCSLTSSSILTLGLFWSTSKSIQLIWFIFCWLFHFILDTFWGHSLPISSCCKICELFRRETFSERSLHVSRPKLCLPDTRRRIVVQRHEYQYSGLMECQYFFCFMLMWFSPFLFYLWFFSFYCAIKKGCNQLKHTYLPWLLLFTTYFLWERHLTSRFRVTTRPTMAGLNRVQQDSQPPVMPLFALCAMRPMKLRWAGAKFWTFCRGALLLINPWRTVVVLTIFRESLPAVVLHQAWTYQESLSQPINMERMEE